MKETTEFPFWGLNICVDFDLRDSKKMEIISKLKKIIFQYTLIFPKMPNPICETRVLKLVFITILCLKVWAQIKTNGSYLRKKGRILAEPHLFGKFKKV